MPLRPDARRLPAACLSAVLCVLLAPALPARAVDLAGRVLEAGRPIHDSVIWVDAPAASARRPAHAVMDQRNLTFLPHVLAVRVGTVVDFPNHDRVFHNVFSYHDGKRFDLGLYPAGASRPEPMRSPGLRRLFCNIHPNMAAYIMVIDSPYFAVSDAAGRFVIRGVPPGDFVYHTWKPGSGIKSGTVSTGAGALDVRWP